MSHHDAKVQVICDEVRKCPVAKTLRILKRPPVANTHRRDYKNASKTHPVDVRSLGDIICVRINGGDGFDEPHVHVEGHVTLQTLCSMLLPLGLSFHPTHSM